MRLIKWTANLLVSQLVWLLIGGFVGTIGSAILKAADVLSNPYGLVAIGFLIAAMCVAIIQKLQERRSLPGASNSDFMAELYGELKEERTKRARQLAKEEIDREVKRGLRK
jgi:hypothetical protein